MQIPACFNLSKDESDRLIDNVFKALSMAAIPHILTVIVSDDKQLFTDNIVRKFLFIVIAMVFYTLIIRPILIKPKVEEKK